MPDYSALLGDLESTCKRAAQLALEMRPSMDREIKPDGSIVTTADKACEIYIRGRIATAMPGAPVWGEEFGFEEPSEQGLWLVDPIDGTSNFAFGQPLWGVTAAYVQDGAIQLGAICVPELDWSFAAMRGKGAFLNGARMEVLAPGAIEPYELVGYGDAKMASGHGFPGKFRHIGAFVVEAGAFATGGLRALLTNGVRMYDAAAGVVLAREVGAEVKELDGSDWRDADWTKPIRCRTFGFFPQGSNWPFSQSQ
ncbi:MAG: inositol monophosphatase family protein [Fimbriimonadaceae bacterium]